ncbi:hypothetical protein FEM48_Zijuj04G0115100 [Ziziphus jujuba var. spinosa]|uniref:Uncharacterized protein n=1 Tax=Ziziphus jujuba var. spinosa TaxID=714518 RepID=A0A978VJM1_ZIZJJ|nr:hypothetical protein FEM48_Zijuj04G0115100 [Ziziphus jujuba var. spinosa]
MAPRLRLSSKAKLVLPSFANSARSRILLVDKDEAVFSIFLNQLRSIRKLANGIIINTFLELESRAISSMFDPKLSIASPAGPILNLVSDDDDNNDGN